jgi:hypothetical protein
LWEGLQRRERWWRGRRSFEWNSWVVSSIHFECNIISPSIWKVPLTARPWTNRPKESSSSPSKSNSVPLTNALSNLHRHQSRQRQNHRLIWSHSKTIVVRGTKGSGKGADYGYAGADEEFDG